MREQRIKDYLRRNPQTLEVAGRELSAHALFRMLERNIHAAHIEAALAAPLVTRVTRDGREWRTIYTGEYATVITADAHILTVSHGVLNAPVIAA
ncbi:DUF4258 domain-containing protein [Rhodococcus spongiicola]|uniref:DUF4258 domain-containing protein n=1 Tax=Rhodococcus spongiicola TaxID=2487352 RepID=A0A438B5K6_9NOCA|nr:DUF4258 domain-containing protein [Rhodococcus spongiicola]RVW06240.1 DUF4258 domain-containing protein [Rhodococcus spongiicola]